MPIFAPRQGEGSRAARKYSAPKASGYWTAYLKAHYPDAFMAALMTSDNDDVDRLAIEITECKHMGLEVLSPDVNQSYVEFGVVPAAKQVRFGMAAVKGVGIGAVEEIAVDRKSVV